MFIAMNRFRIALATMLEVLAPYSECIGQVGDRPAVHNTEAGRDAETCAVSLKVPCGRVHYLPDPL